MNPDVNQTVDRSHQQLAMLILSRVLAGFGYFLVLPFLAILLQARHVPIGTIGLSLGILGLGSRVGSLLWVRLLQVARPYLGMMLGMGLSSFGLLLIGDVRNAGIILFAALMIGLGVSLNGLAAKVLLGFLKTEFGPNVRGFGLLNIGLNLAGIAAPLVAGWVLLLNEDRLLFYLAVAFYVGGMTISRLLSSVQPTNHSVGSAVSGILGVFQVRDFSILLFPVMIYWIVFSQMYVLIPLIGLRDLNYSSDNVGLLFSVNGLIVVSLQMHSIKWTQRYVKSPGQRVNMVLGLGFILNILSLTLLLNAKGFIVPWVVIFGYSLAEILVLPTMDSFASTLRTAAGPSASTFLGVLSAVSGLGYLLGSYLGTALFGQPRILWGVFMGLSLLGLCYLWILRRWPNGRRDGTG